MKNAIEVPVRDLLNGGIAAVADYEVSVEYKDRQNPAVPTLVLVKAHVFHDGKCKVFNKTFPNHSNLNNCPK